MTDNGYIKIYRSSLNSELYLSEPFTKWQAWCDLIFLAYYADSVTYIRGRKIQTKRGCVYKSSEELAKRWRWSRGKVLRFLDGLTSREQIIQHPSNVTTCISIVNYDLYLGSGTTDGHAEQKKEPKKNKENISPYIFPPENENEKTRTQRFIKPTISDVEEYCKSKGYNIDAEYFINYYETNGWVQGKNRKPIRNWKACIATWVRNQKDYESNRQYFKTDGGHPSNEQAVLDMYANIQQLRELEAAGFDPEVRPF